MALFDFLQPMYRKTCLMAEGDSVMVSVALVLIQAALLLLLLGSGLRIGPYITLSDTWLLWDVIQSSP